MDLPDSFRNILGNGGGGATPDPEEQAKALDGGQLVVEGEEQIAVELPDDSDVDAEQIEAALSGKAGSVEVKGQTGGDTTVTPVASGTDIHITDSAFDLSNWEYKAFLDDQITNLMENRVDYNQQTGQWILANDDLIPGILIRLKSLMMGQDGLQVKPADPDSEADQRLKEHLEKIYDGDADVESHVDPSKVMDRVLEQNVMNAVFVGRSTDLQHLDVDDLSYVKDGETGEEIYIQDPTGYTTFDIEEDGEPTVEYGWKDESTALEIGKEVLDVRLYRTPPLQAVADDVVNKLQLKRLQGRKAEIASIGGVIIKVNPPAWLPEEDYGNYISENDDQFDNESGRLLELVMAQQIEAALETLEDYQTATVMSIPENWETDTIELPEMDESMSDMIRDYNEAISRRLLLPLDLIELKEGPELSRNSMMQMFLDMIAGWQGQVTDMFDQFAQVQADIHGIGGDVKHELPQIEAQDETEILQLFNFAGLLGLSESESRELANVLEGVDLETDQTEGLPEEGGPEDPEERFQQMRDALENGAGDGPEDGPGNGADDGGEGGPSGGEPQGSTVEDGMAAADSETCWVCGSEATHRDRMPPYEYVCADHARSIDEVPIEQAEAIVAGATVEADWDPDAHPRGPDGKFIPKLSNLFDMVPDSEQATDSDVEEAIEDFEDALPEAQRLVNVRGPDDSDMGRVIIEETDEELKLVDPTENTDVQSAAASVEGIQMRLAGADVTDTPSRQDVLQAEASYSEGEEVETPSGMGVVVEVRTEDFDGPDGDVEASDDDPAYIVGVEDGVRVYRGSDLSEGQIDADVDDPEGDLAAAKAALASGPDADEGWLLAARGDGRFSYPDSWEESDTPARLILLKAWAGMNGQFDCGGDCCKGTMLKNGMAEPAANRFCASMKDRVMGGWEGWRRGGGSAAPVEASHAFSGFETMREAAAHVRDVVERKTPEGHTTEMRKRQDLDEDAFAIIVRDRQGDFRASMVVREAETEDDQWRVIGGQGLFR